MNPDCYSPAGLIENILNLNSSTLECQEILKQASELPEVGFLIYLKYFLLTCALEAPFYFVVMHLDKNKFSKLDLKNFLAAVFFCNLATHPMVCFGIPWITSLFHGTYGQSLLVGEIFAPVVEALFLIYWFKRPILPSWLLSLLANLFSWWMGVYLTQISN